MSINNRLLNTIKLQKQNIRDNLCDQRFLRYNNKSTPIKDQINLDFVKLNLLLEDTVGEKKDKSQTERKYWLKTRISFFKLSKLSNMKTNNFKNWQTTEQTFHLRRHRHTWEM